MKKFLLLLVLLTHVAAMLSAQKATRTPFTPQAEAQINEMSQQASFSVLAQAQKYVYAYYGRRDFSAPQWMRVKNFLTWLKQNEAQLNTQFLGCIGSQWAKFSDEKRQVALGAWLGMKYAVDKIGGKPDKQFSVVLSEKIWEDECGDASNRKTIYCSKGDFVSKFNVGLHEAVHLLPYLRRMYRPGRDWEDSYREKYTVASQIRYALPAKKISRWSGSTRTFFPVYNSSHALDLLTKEYAEGVAALIDYDDIWRDTLFWSFSEDNTDVSLDMRLREEVFFQLGVSEGEDREVFYSYKANQYFQEVGKEIIKTYCNQLPPKEGDGQNQADYLHDCFDKNAAGILKISAEKLKPLVSKNIPPVPAGYM